ncbi:hypothetical protein [Mucilaginibacter defluvii]|uniref:Uncharacterized protein n=1 Tax=Mucilaginibacter defluvii TaxID=1196019 RepID=A0ABP9FV69_9SPHI
MIVKHSEQKNNVYTSQTINGFSVKAYLNVTTFNNGDATLGCSKVDFSKCNFKVTLQRDGKDHVLVQDNLKVIGLASTLNTIQQQAFYAGTDHVVKLGNGKSIVAFNIPLGGFLRVKDTDKLIVEVTMQEGVFPDANYLQNSYIEFKTLKSIGYEQYIPFIRTQNIQQGNTSEQFSIGSNVLRTAFINYDKTDFQNNVIVNMSVSSDRYVESLNYGDLINMKTASFSKLPSNLWGDAGAAFEADQSFLITDFTNQFNDLVLDVSFNGDQVAQSKNYLVWWSYKTDASIVQKAEQLASKHQDKLVADIAKATV